MKSTLRSLGILVLAATAALAIGACGSSSSSSDTHTVTVTHIVTDQGTSTSSTTTTATTNTATTTTSGGGTTASACRAATLTPAELGSNGAAGTIVYGFALKNTGSAACHTYGYPGVSFLSASGATLPTDVKRTTQDIVGTVTPTAINLAPGQQASFRITIEDAYKGGALCKTARYLRIYAPDDTAPMKLTLSGGAQACGWGRVTALEPGTSAFSGQ